MAKEERVYNVPLRKEFSKVPKYKRAKKAIYSLIEFIKKHMKAEEVRLGKHVNEYIWSKGMKNPPHHVKIHVLVDENGIARAELVGKTIDMGIKEEKEKKSGIAEKLGLAKKKLRVKSEKEDKGKDKETEEKDEKAKDTAEEKKEQTPKKDKEHSKKG